jgi:hypothetical protein
MNLRISTLLLTLASVPAFAADSAVRAGDSYLICAEERGDSDPKAMRQATNALNTQIAKLNSGGFAYAHFGDQALAIQGPANVSAPSFMQGRIGDTSYATACVTVTKQ